MTYRGQAATNDHGANEPDSTRQGAGTLAVHSEIITCYLDACCAVKTE
jgi:hypothetical protein